MPANWPDRCGPGRAGERSARIVLVDVGDDDATNLAVTDLRPLQRQLVTGVDTQIEAAVGNFGARAAEALELDVVTGQSARASARLGQAPPGAVSRVAIPVMFQRGGDVTVQVSASEDNLPIDNVRWLAVEVNEAIRILVVNGEPSADAYLDEADLLATALRPEGDVFSGEPGGGDCGEPVGRRDVCGLPPRYSLQSVPGERGRGRGVASVRCGGRGPSPFLRRPGGRSGNLQRGAVSGRVRAAPRGAANHGPCAGPRGVAGGQ